MSVQDFSGVADPTIANVPKSHPRPVFFAEDTAPEPGRLVCYVRDYTSSASGEASTDAAGYRGNRVVYPTVSNNGAVAGVIAESAFGRPAVTGGQWIDIYLPGSIANILVDIPTTLNTTRLTATVSAIPGVFTEVGLDGRGSALALQAIANITSKTTTTPGPIFQTLDGSATWTVATLTVTKTNIGLYAIPGDRFIVYAAASTGGAAAGTAGEYIVDTVPTDDTITLVSAGPLVANGFVAGVLVRGKPRVMALLDAGEESGLTQWSTPLNNVAASPAPMVGGLTHFFGGITLATGVSTFTLADGTRHGIRKAFNGRGTLTTNGMAVSPTSAVIEAGTALTTITVDAAAEFWLGQWFGNYADGTTGVWKTIATAGATLA